MRNFTQSWQTNWNKLNKYVPALAVVIVFGGLGTAFLLTSHATTPVASFQAEGGTVSAAASAVSDSTASGSQAVKFGASSGGGGTRTCPAYPAPPDASCTGVPAGTNLTTINGGYTTTSDGQVIDGKLINGDLGIANKNVTVKNSRIVGRISNSASKGGLVVMDSDIGLDSCQASAYENGDYNNFNGTNYTMIRSHVHNAGADLMGMGGTGTILIQDSIVNQACYYSGDHLDAIQFYSPGSDGKVTIQHSFFDSRAVNSGGANGNAAIFWADNPGSGSHLTVTQTWLAGGNYTASLYDANAGSGVILDLNNNTFVKNSYTYGACSGSNSVTFNGTEGIKFTNNKYDDGTSLSSC